jgi:hypothetical protein
MRAAFGQFRFRPLFGPVELRVAVKGLRNDDSLESFLGSVDGNSGRMERRCKIGYATSELDVDYRSR